MYLPNEKQTEFIFYVYAYLRINGTPYYIGKGCRYRAYEKHRGNLLPKDANRIVFLETELSDIGSLALERRYIKWYGRKDLGTGILRNMTDGGDGASGSKRTDEQKKQQSVRMKGRPGISGRKMTEENRAKLSISNKNRVVSDETKAKMRLAGLGRTISEETRNKHKEFRHSDETKETLKEMSTGRIISDAARKKIGDSRLGKSLSDETKNKIRQKRALQIMSDETKAKISASMKIRRAKLPIDAE